LNDAIIKSPIDGTAVDVNVKEGDTVPAVALLSFTPIYLVDTATIQVSAQIDEIDIAGVKIDQKVLLNLDSAPDVKYEGKVKSISLTPSANPQNTGIVVYEVKIVFAKLPPAEVKLGMTAVVDIITNERTNILLVPNRAIKEDNQGNTVVDVLVNQKVETRQVKLGIGDSIYTEVLSGLNSGETVLITRSGANTSLFGK
jgi:multidrug efflux pump subunit AcrA (membrane-fusion protein)